MESIQCWTEAGNVLLRDSSNESDERARSATAAQAGLALSSRLLPFLLSVFFLKCPRSHAFDSRDPSSLAISLALLHRPLCSLRRDGGRKRDAAKKKRAGKEGRLHLATQGTVHRRPEDTVCASVPLGAANILLIGPDCRRGPYLEWVHCIGTGVELG